MSLTKRGNMFLLKEIQQLIQNALDFTVVLQVLEQVIHTILMKKKAFMKLFHLKMTETKRRKRKKTEKYPLACI